MTGENSVDADQLASVDDQDPHFFFHLHAESISIMKFLYTTGMAGRL